MTRRRKPTDDEITSAYRDDGLTLAEVGARFGYSQSWAYKRLKAIGVNRRPAGGRRRRRVDDAGEQNLVAEAVKLYVDEGFPLTEVGARVGRSRWWVRDRLVRSGVEIRAQGGPHGIGRATPEMLEELRRLYIDDELNTDAISRRVGMSQSWVSRQLFEVLDVPVRSRRRIDVDVDVVMRLYVDERSSLGAVARHLGVSDAVVRRALVEHGIPIRGLDAARTIHCDELQRLYVDEELSGPEIARRLGVSSTGVASAMKRCGIAARRPPRLDVTRLQLQQHLDDGLSNAEIAELYGVATWAVTRRLRSDGLRRPQPKPAHTRPSPPPEELRALYVDSGATLAAVATHFGVPHATVRRWLDEIGIRRRKGPATKAAGRRQQLTKELLEELYTDEELTAAEIGRLVGISKKLVLKDLHHHRIPVRPPGGRRPALSPLLDRLYGDPAIVEVLESHDVPIVATTGSLRERFPDPLPLTEALLRALYSDLGLSVSKISLVTGHGDLAVRVGLQEARIATRSHGRSPWTSNQTQVSG